MACPAVETAVPLDGPDVFFNSSRVARMLGVELADRDAIVREYVGQRITARFALGHTVATGRNATTSKLGKWVAQGRVKSLERGVDVAYTIYLDDPDVLNHKIKQHVEVVGTVSAVEWETVGASQTLRVTAVASSFRRLDD